MGAVSGLLGVGGGTQGTGQTTLAPQQIVSPVTAAQAQTAYTGNQTALAQQQAFLQALQAQNGIGNQSNVFNQLQNIASGQGPNPAQAMLAQSTGQNVANQAALMAGQRGANQNVGLIARQAAHQGANTQQQAAGQAATMQAQQSLGALNQLGGIAGQQVTQQQAGTGAVTGAQLGEQQALLNSIAGQNQASVGLNQASSGLAGQVMGGQQNLIGNIFGGAGSAMNMAEGGRVHYANGALDVGNQGQYVPIDSSQMPPPMPQAPAAPQAPTAPPPPKAGPQSRVGQHLAAQSSGNQLTGMSQTGNVLGKAIGAGLNAMFSSSPSSAAPANSAQQTYDLMSAKPGSDQDVYNHMTGANTMVNAPLQTTQQQTEGDQSADNSDATPGNNMAKGGKVPAMVSPGEKYLKPQDVEKVKRGANPMKVGETIPGKPRVGGAKNSYANDTVPKTLDEGGIVLPRSVTQSKNPEWAAHRFVKAYMAQGGKVALPKKAKK